MRWLTWTSRRRIIGDYDQQYPGEDEPRDQEADQHRSSAPFGGRRFAFRVGSLRDN